MRKLARKLLWKPYLVLRNWWKDRQAEMAEKGVMMAILILAVLAALNLLGGKISNWFTSVANAY